MKSALAFWFTGLSGAGKSTIASRVRWRLEKQGFKVLILDGDEVRKHQSRNLGFSEADIKANNSIIVNLCLSSRRKYDVILVPIISPYSSSRKEARDALSPGFYEIYFNANIETVGKRDKKGLYAKAAIGEIDNLIGFSPKSSYEVPKHPDYVANTEKEDVSETDANLYDFVVRQLKDTKLD